MLDLWKKTKARRRVLQFFAGHGRPVPKLRIALSDDHWNRNDGAIVRDGDGYVIEFSKRAAHRRPNMISRRAAPFLFYFDLAPKSVERMRVHFSDGDVIGPPAFCFSRYGSSDCLLPDMYFFEKSGFADLRALVADSAVDWEARSADLVWRGSPTGTGLICTRPEMVANRGVNQRVRCAALCHQSDIDFGFVLPPNNPNRQAFGEAGWLRDRMPNVAWFGMKYALDLDGFANTWDNQFHRMLMGCCLLKVAGDFGYRQWYYDRLEPWVHYVPVKADLSDLFEKYDWVRSHDAEAREIAAAGQALALSMTFDKEAQFAANEIENNWKRFI